MGENKHSKVIGLSNILGETEIHNYNSQNMGKVNSRSKGKIWENTNISNLEIFQIILMERKFMQFPKHRKIGLP